MYDTAQARQALDGMIAHRRRRRGHEIVTDTHLLDYAALLLDRERAHVAENVERLSMISCLVDAAENLRILRGSVAALLDVVGKIDECDLPDEVADAISVARERVAALFEGGGHDR